MRDGLKTKYIVRKAETGEVVEGCFVLRPGKDPAAATAIRAYAAAAANDALSADLLRWVGLPPNAPLTLNELREMEGEPVWMTIPGENGGEWVIARNIDLGDVCIFCPVGAKRQYGVDRSGSIGDYGKTWLAYRRRPEEGTA